MTTSFETISQNITLLTNCIFQSKSEGVKKIAFFANDNDYYLVVKSFKNFSAINRVDCL